MLPLFVYNASAYGCTLGQTSSLPHPQAIHWAEEDHYFYAISGGRIISLARSKDLKVWVPAARDGGPFIRPDHAIDGRVAPYMGMPAHIAADKAGVLKADLEHAECWDHNSNDADFCCGGLTTGGGAPLNVAWVFYSASSQGKPPDATPNCSRVYPKLAVTNVNAIATANVGLGTLLSSYFK